jgi:membrane associated rhomboid family serine protease
MTLRTLSREIKDYPATACLSLAWFVVFVGMVSSWLRADAAPTWWRFLIMGVDGHRFGDLTLRELFQGQVWRVITCSFVHMSVLHLGLNLLAFYLLGTLLESWYGTPQFIFIYVVTGGVGNLLSALFRHAIGSNPNVHSGGGSVVIMGLVGLCAMAGWRSRTERGSDMGWQMTKAIGITALLGIAFHRYIDNWGHAGGAIVGLVAGLFHRVFIRQYHRPAAWGLGVGATFILLASGLAQVSADRREAPARSELRDYVERIAYDDANRSMGIVALLGERLVDPRVVIHIFQMPRNRELFLRGRTGPAYQRALAIAEAALVRVLSQEEQAEFDRCLGSLSSQILTAFTGLLRQKSTQADFDRLRSQAVAAETRVLSDEEKDEFKTRLAPVKALVQRELEERIRKQWQRRRTPTPAATRR